VRYSGVGVNGAFREQMRHERPIASPRETRDCLGVESRVICPYKGIRRETRDCLGVESRVICPYKGIRRETRDCLASSYSQFSVPRPEVGRSREQGEPSWCAGEVEGPCIQQTAYLMDDYVNE
jgi:hypothetical protein